MKIQHKKKIAIFAGMLMLMGILLGTAMIFAANEHISVRVPDKAELTVGQLYTLELSEIFTDEDGHSLEYSLDDSDYGTMTYIKDGKLIFTVENVGSYSPVITAVCEAGETASCRLDIQVEEASEGEDAQYGYDETDADSVTVYVTVSSDGIPIRGRDGEETILSHLEVTVPYFDLGLYDLQDYYRYATDNGKGPYTGTEVIQRPTAFHLYIYLLERYFMGLDEELCATGASDVLQYSEYDDVADMFGGTAYNSSGRKALSISGGATSLYMVNFWGHDENLMYFRNHVYPLMSAGWGATSDYMLLSDGDTIDLAMFSNWDFYQYGGFTCLDEDEYQLTAGETLEFGVWTHDTLPVANGGEATYVLKKDMDVNVYTEDWMPLDSLNITDDGTYQYRFKEPGTYYLMAMDQNRGTEDAAFAPATAKVVVSEETVTGDVNGDGLLDAQDISLLYEAVRSSGDLSADMLNTFDINQDGILSVKDVTALYILIRQKE